MRPPRHPLAFLWQGAPEAGQARLTAFQRRYLLAQIFGPPKQIRPRDPRGRPPDRGGEG